jgi:thiamine-phosphate pyrophosphorylase
MLVLLTHPEIFPGEADLLNRMLAEHSGLTVHLRKPRWNRVQTAQLLSAIGAIFHKQIVLHRHHELLEHYTLKGLHVTAEDRKRLPLSPAAISTSFHSLEEALHAGDSFRHFFCSPVFQSISKPGYTGTENWDISGQPEKLRAKAVALGGIDSTTIQQARLKGFRHFAVLGAVWQSGDPEMALRELLNGSA